MAWKSTTLAVSDRTPTVVALDRSALVNLRSLGNQTGEGSKIVQDAVGLAPFGSADRGRAFAQSARSGRSTKAGLIGAAEGEASAVPEAVRFLEDGRWANRDRALSGRALDIALWSQSGA